MYLVDGTTHGETMDPVILLFFGGVGLFLLGMLLLTDGLQGLTGTALRQILARFTRSPVTGALAGAMSTAVVQSSSAITVTTIGFVGAGLLTFAQALGIVFGANIGTTITGWIVVILGFKLQLGLAVLPLLLLGVLLRMFGRGRWTHLGWALAGFSLLFVGIDAMQQGMAPFEGSVTPDNFPADTLIGRLQLVLIGVAVTLVTQSSSAGVATALVALNAGAISFPQAAAMVIGMDVGTTFTAALAAIGGSTARRQTGYAHVIYNLLTGVMAFFLLTPFAAALQAWSAAGGVSNPQIFLVAFHTIFNTVGVLLVLPFTKPFARFIIWLVPQRGPPLLSRLDERLLSDASAAVDAAIATIGEIAAELFGLLAELLDPIRRRRVDRARLQIVKEALHATRGFVDQIRTSSKQPNAHRRHLAAMHALDHLSRLHHRSTQTARVQAQQSEPHLRRLSAVLRTNLVDLPQSRELAASARKFDRLQETMRRQRRSYRETTVAAASAQRIGASVALRRLDGIRWLHRVAYHVWRILHHLQEGGQVNLGAADAFQPADAGTSDPARSAVPLSRHKV